MRQEDAEALARVQAESYDRVGRGLRSSWPPAKALDADALAAYLDARQFCALATARPDGRAQARPVGFTVWEGSFWIASMPGARLRNLRSQPWASLVVMEGERNAHTMVLAEGTVSLHETLPRGLDDEWEQRHGSKPTWAAAFIELRPARLFSFGRN